MSDISVKDYLEVVLASVRRTRLMSVLLVGAMILSAVAWWTSRNIRWMTARIDYATTAMSSIRNSSPDDGYWLWVVRCDQAEELMAMFGLGSDEFKVQSHADIMEVLPALEERYSRLRDDGYTNLPAENLTTLLTLPMISAWVMFGVLVLMGFSLKAVRDSLSEVISIVDTASASDVFRLVSTTLILAIPWEGGRKPRRIRFWTKGHVEGRPREPDDYRYFTVPMGTLRLLIPFGLLLWGPCLQATATMHLVDAEWILSASYGWQDNVTFHGTFSVVLAFCGAVWCWILSWDIRKKTQEWRNKIVNEAEEDFV